MRGGFKENISPNSLGQFWHHTIKIDAKKINSLLVVFLAAFSFPETWEQKG